MNAEEIELSAPPAYVLEQRQPRPSTLTKRNVDPKAAKKLSVANEPLVNLLGKHGSKVDLVTIANFGMLIFAIVTIALSWMLIDIFLTFVSPFDEPNQKLLQFTTWGLLHIVLSFVLKALICFKLHPDVVPIHDQVSIVIIGSILHMGLSSIVRVPMYSRYSKYTGISQSVISAMSYWYTTNGGEWFALFLISMLGRYVLDYILLPWIVRRYSLRKIAKTKMPEGKRKKSVIDTSILPITLWWMGMVMVFTFLTSFFPNLSAIMYAASWAPLIIGIWAIREDSVKEFSQVYVNLRQSFPYLAFYLWLIDIFPDLCGSVLSLFLNLENSVLRFAAKVVFLAFVTYIKLLSKRVILFCGHTASIQLQLLAPIQYLQAFFELMLFIALSLNDASFWALLVLQALSNGFNNAFGLSETAKFLAVKFLKAIGKSTAGSNGNEPEPVLASQNMVDMFYEKNIYELLGRRIRLRSKVQELLQMFIVDSVLISAIVSLYYAYVYFLLGNTGELQARIYSYYFGIKTVDELYSPLLLVQFVVVYIFRSLGNLLPLAYLHNRVKQFNIDVKDISRISDLPPPTGTLAKILEEAGNDTLPQEMAISVSTMARSSATRADATLNTGDPSRSTVPRAPPEQTSAGTTTTRRATAGEDNSQPTPQQPSMITIPKISIWNVFFRYLDNGWWLFFLLVGVTMSRAGFSVRSVLFNTDEALAKTIGDTFGIYYSSNPYYWVEAAMLRFLLN